MQVVSTKYVKGVLLIGVLKAQAVKFCNIIAYDYAVKASERQLCHQTSLTGLESESAPSDSKATKNFLEIM